MNTAEFPQVALRRLFSIVNGATPDSQNKDFWEGDVTWVTPEDLSNRRLPDVSESKRTLTRSGYESCGTSLVPPGSLILSTRAPIGNLGIAATHLCSNQGCKSLVPLTAVANSRFFFYQLSVLTRELNRLGKGTTFLELSSSELAGFKVFAPKVTDQERIANFLDDKTGRIDALIAEKERLATSLEEYRLSAINSAVSTGLSSSPGLSETSDEWFEKIPTHWSFCPLNYRYEIQLGKMLDEKQITGNFLRPYLRNTDVQWGRINVENLPQMDISPDELSRYTVMPGDLMVCEGGDVGRAAIWDGTAGEMAYQKALHRVRPRSQRDLPKFMYYCLFDSAKRGRFSGRGQATIAHLTAEAFRRYRFAFPPVEEQQAIVLHLDGITQKLDTLVRHCEEHIARLREYRSSLISAAVTGELRSVCGPRSAS